MRKTPLLALTMIVVIGAVAWTSANPATPKVDTERTSLKVLKVFSAKDGDGRFQAYMVNWKGQDVVVQDTLVKTDYHEGDTIPVLMTRNKYPKDLPGPDLINFMVMPVPPGVANE